MKKMASIQEDTENEGMFQDSEIHINKNLEGSYGDENEDEGNFKQKRQNDLLIGKVASKLISDKSKQLDNYGKNLIKYYDVINHVVSERKRKTTPATDLQNINTEQSRKGAQSLFTNQVPF